MPHRIDIEITSRRSDDEWTWRAAGARQPKGLIPAPLVPDGAKPGDVLRVEVESGIDGLEIVGVLPPKPETDQGDATRIEVLGPRRADADISVVLASRGRRRDSSEGERGGRSRRAPGHDRSASGDGAGRERRGDRTAGRGRRNGTADGAGEGPHKRPGTGRAGERPSREVRAGRARREGRDRPEDRGDRQDRDGAAATRRGPLRERRPAVSMAHRNAALAQMRSEEIPIAEQLLRGGLPAVRQAIQEQNANASQEGRPPISAESLMAIAERLLPAVNLASWKDRASVAQAAGREVRLRELRAVVAASRTVVLDQEGRSMAKALQESLDQRVAALREEWLTRISKALDNGRIADAIRTASRPPEPSTRCPADLAVRLAEASGNAMTAELSREAWLELLDAVVNSPIRRNVHPSGIPDDADVKSAALRAAGSVPALARLLGLPQPPPPPRRTTPVRERVGASRRSGS